MQNRIVSLKSLDKFILCDGRKKLCLRGANLRGLKSDWKNEKLEKLGSVMTFVQLVY